MSSRALVGPKSRVPGALVVSRLDVHPALSDRRFVRRFRLGVIASDLAALPVSLGPFVLALLPANAAHDRVSPAARALRLFGAAAKSSLDLRLFQRDAGDAGDEPEAQAARGGGGGGWSLRQLRTAAGGEVRLIRHGWCRRGALVAGPVRSKISFAKGQLLVNARVH